MHFAVFGERLCDVVKKIKLKHPCAASLVDVFKPYYTAYNFVALYVSPGMHFIAA